MSFLVEKERKQSKKEQEKAYQEYLNDPLTFSLDEMLGTLGPHYETKRVN